MKLTELLIVTCCSIIAARSETAKTDQALLRRASEQLERLAPYRRAASRGDSDLSNLPEAWRSPVDQNVVNDETTTTSTRSDDTEQGVPWEIFEILPDETKPTEEPTAKRVADEKSITFSILADPRYAAMMQERIKRGFDAGTSSLLSGIAGGLISGVASASGSSAAKASSSSSQSTDYHKPVYGAPPVYGAQHSVYTYEEKPFGPLDFKKAIFSTLFQAIKAIGGGVLALKGQLVKGGGYLLSAKAKVISKTGDVITSFGKQLASNIAAHYSPPETYAYGSHPPAHGIEHDAGYQGPPPSDYSDTNDYSAHSTYGVPSEDSDQGGLLIVTPTKSDADGHGEPHASVVQEKPDLTKLEESFGGPAKGSTIKDFFSSVPKGSGGPTDHQASGQEHIGGNTLDSYPPLDHPSPTYGAPEHYFPSHDGAPPSHPSVSGNAYHQPATPQHHFPFAGDSLSVHPDVGFPPLHAQQLEYPAPSPLLGAFGSKLPHNEDDGGTSVYASLSVDTEPPLLGYPGGAFNSHKLQPHASFHGQPPFAGLHSGLDGPLRIPLFNSPLAHYWQGHGSLSPASAFGTLNSFRKRNVLQRRTFADRLARYSSLRPTGLHRL